MYGGDVMRPRQMTLVMFGCIVEPYRVVYPRPYLWKNGVKKTIQKKLSDFGMGIKTRSL